MKTTHATVSEFTIHPAGIIEAYNAQVGIMSLGIPQLKKTEASWLRLSNSENQKGIHYIGPSKMNPSAKAMNSICEADQQHLTVSLVKAKDRDAAYYLQFRIMILWNIQDTKLWRTGKHIVQHCPKPCMCLAPCLIHHLLIQILCLQLCNLCLNRFNRSE